MGSQRAVLDLLEFFVANSLINLLYDCKITGKFTPFSVDFIYWITFSMIPIKLSKSKSCNVFIMFDLPPQAPETSFYTHTQSMLLVIDFWTQNSVGFLAFEPSKIKWMQSFMLKKQNTFPATCVILTVTSCQNAQVNKHSTRKRVDANGFSAPSSSNSSACHIPLIIITWIHFQMVLLFVRKRKARCRLSKI